jgi:streptogramin lyase
VLNLSLSTNTISPYINEVIATISAEGRPTGDILVVPTDNGNMPPASTLVIGADGTITYTGSATNQIGNDYYVELFMIRYLL